jgi:hypothetical protein
MDSFVVGRMVAFIDEQIDSMLNRPSAWGPLWGVEMQVLLALVIRAFALGSVSAGYLVPQAYHAFIVSLLGDTASVEPLATQLEVRGRSIEFISAMSEFVASQREVTRGSFPKLYEKGRAVGVSEVPLEEMKKWVNDPFKLADEIGTMMGRLSSSHLVPLFEKHCECRPTNTIRFSHSHDCDTEVTNDVRTVLHRVVLSGPDADMYGQRDDHRPATDEEVRAARLRLAEILSKASKQ